MNTKKVLAISGAAAVTLLMAMPAFAATTAPAVKGTHKFSVVGTVSAINGNTLTVTTKNNTIYAVDVSTATLQKGFGKKAETISLSGIAVDDHVAVEGPVTGTSVEATDVHDGVRSGSHAAGKNAAHTALANAAFGKVTSVNGSTITLTHKTKEGDTAVTISTTESTVYKKNGVADTASDVVVGDRIVAMGTKDSSGNISNATTVNILVHGEKTKTAVTPA